MSDDVDYSALKWVKKEIDATLHEAGVSLETYSEDGGGDDHLKKVATNFHQVYGTLQIVEVFGASLLVEEMELVVSGLLDGTVNQKEEAVEVLSRSILQIPDYLERLQSGQKDIPIVLLPLMNDLRASRGANLVSEAAMFSPDMSKIESASGETHIITKAKSDVTRLAKSLRHSYHKHQLAVLKGVDVTENLKRISDVFATLERSLSFEATKMVWAVCQAYVDTLAVGGVEVSFATKQLLRQIDNQIKKIIDDGEVNAADNPDLDLLKNLLYYIAHATRENKKIGEIKDEYALRNAIPTEDEIANAQSDMTAPNAELMRSVTGAIKEDLLKVKDTLDMFVRGGQSQSDLKSLVDPLRKMADTFSMLGQGSLRNIILQQADYLESYAAGGDPPNEDQIMQVAGELLVIEASLDNMLSGKDRGQTDLINDDDIDPVAFSAIKSSGVLDAVLHEVAIELSKSKEAISAYIENPDEPNLLEKVPEYLTRIHGALNVLNLKRADVFLTAINEFIKEKLLAQHIQLKQDKLEAFADAISSIEYYVEAIKENRGNRDEILEHAKKSLALLGQQVILPDTDNSTLEALKDVNVGIAVNDMILEALEPMLIEEGEAEIKLETEKPKPKPNKPKKKEKLAVVPEPVAPSQEALTLDDVDEEILEIFIEEAQENIEMIRDQYPKWKNNPDDKEALSTFRRSYHTIKGSGRMVKAAFISEVAWSVENMINRVIDETIQQSPSMLMFMDEVSEELPVLLQALVTKKTPLVDIDRLIAWGEALSKGEQPMPSKTPSKPKQAASLVPEVVEEIVVAPVPETEPLEVVDLGDLNFSIDELVEPVAIDEEPAKASVDIKPVMDPVLYEIFNNESNSHLNVIQKFISNARRQNNVLLEDSVRRALHTLHGSAHMAGVTEVAELSRKLEKLSKTLVAKKIVLTGDLLDIFDRGVAATEDMLFSLSKPDVPMSSCDELCKDIDCIYEQVDKSQADTTVEKTRFVDHGDDNSPAPDEVDDELLEIFLEEGIELIDAIENAIQDWNQNHNDMDIIADLQRSLHTLKGGSRLSGLTVIGDLSHSLETMLTAVANKTLEVDSSIVELVHQAVDELAAMVDLVGRRQILTPATELIANMENIAGFDASIDETQDITAQDVADEMPEEAIEIEEIAIAPPEELIEELIEIDAIEIPDITDNEVVNVTDIEVVEAAASSGEFDEELIEIFLEEGLEIIDTIESTLTAWKKSPQNQEHIVSLQRSLHTLKGGGRLAGLNVIGDLSHAMESMFESIAEGKLAVSDIVITVTHEVADELAILIDLVSKQQELPSEEQLIAKVESIIAGKDSAEPIPEQVEIVDVKPVIEEQIIENAEPEVAATSIEKTEIKPSEPVKEETPVTKKAEKKADKKKVTKRGIQEQVRVRADLLDNLVNYAGEVSIYRSRLEQQNGSFRFNITEMDQTVVRLKEQLRRLEMETEAQILYTHSIETEEQEVKHDDFDPLEMDRYSTVQQLSRALVESASDLVSLQEMMDNLTRETETLLLQQSRVVTELQEGLMRTRMVPFSSMVPRMNRLVRQTSSQLKKKAELEVLGAEGEMDRAILDGMIAPLEHMIRNALSHGVETPEKRRDVGKSEIGQITLHLSREGTDVVLEVSDDGGGIPIEHVKQKAIKSGMLKEEDADNLSEEDILQFILESGFSTADAITQIAGRGVGMDVVNSEIKQLGGTLEIYSKQGKGTRFIVRLPFTLAINQALLVQVGEETYAVPHTSIDGVVRLSKDELERCYKTEAPIYEYAGQKYQIQHIGNMLGSIPTPLSELPGRWAPILLVRSGQHRVALQVDSLLGNREIVVKSVGPQLSTVRWITGATILGDGRVVLILDVGALVRVGAVFHVAGEIAAREKEAEKPQIHVMVVDDSITVRKVTTRLLERHEMMVSTAKDGVDAVAKLQDEIPDIMLLDIEMPRMDGYELAQHIRNNERLKDIPIIMITSRTGEKHRQRAMDIGVNSYLGKPYQESELLENINKLLDEVNASS